MVLLFLLGCDGPAAPIETSRSDNEKPAVAVPVAKRKLGRDVVLQDAPPEIRHGKIDWNGAQIKWWPFEEGMAQAKKHDLDVVFVAHATWCGTCEKAARFFHDPRIVKGSEYFVMILTDVDLEPVAAQKFKLEYIPRILFLDPNGELLDISLDRDERKYYYTGETKEELLWNMKVAYKRER